MKENVLSWYEMGNCGGLDQHQTHSLILVSVFDFNKNL